MIFAFFKKKKVCYIFVFKAFFSYLKAFVLKNQVISQCSISENESNIYVIFCVLYRTLCTLFEHLFLILLIYELCRNNTLIILNRNTVITTILIYLIFIGAFLEFFFFNHCLRSPNNNCKKSLLNNFSDDSNIILCLCENRQQQPR